MNLFNDIMQNIWIELAQVNWPLLALFRRSCMRRYTILMPLAKWEINCYLTSLPRGLQAQGFLSLVEGPGPIIAKSALNSTTLPHYWATSSCPLNHAIMCFREQKNYCKAQIINSPSILKATKINITIHSKCNNPLVRPVPLAKCYHVLNWFFFQNLVFWNLFEFSAAEIT